MAQPALLPSGSALNGSLTRGLLKGRTSNTSGAVGTWGSTCAPWLGLKRVGSEALYRTSSRALNPLSPVHWRIKEQSFFPRPSVLPSVHHLSTYISIHPSEFCTLGILFVLVSECIEKIRIFFKKKSNKISLLH